MEKMSDPHPCIFSRSCHATAKLKMPLPKTEMTLAKSVLPLSGCGYTYTNTIYMYKIIRVDVVLFKMFYYDAGERLQDGAGVSHGGSQRDENGNEDCAAV